MERTRVLLVAESPLLATLIQERLRGEGRLHVTAQVVSWETLRAWAEVTDQDEVDVVLYVGGSRVAATPWRGASGEVRPPLVLVDSLGAIGLQRALELGARGYVGPDETGPELVERVLRAARGAPALPPDAAPQLRKMLQQITREELRARGLIPIEERLLRWVANGTPVKEMARRLNSSPGAAQGRLRRLRTKLGVETLRELARLAAEAGFVGDEEADHPEDASR